MITSHELRSFEETQESIKKEHPLMPGEMTTDKDRMLATFPIWFVSRVKNDVWYFALIMNNGDAIYISGINRLSRDCCGNLYMDVELQDKIFNDTNNDQGGRLDGKTSIYSLDSRNTATVRVDQISYFLETAYT